LERLKPGFGQVFDQNFNDCFAVLCYDEEQNRIGKNEFIVLLKNLNAIIRGFANKMKNIKTTNFTPLSSGQIHRIASASDSIRSKSALSV